MVDPIEMSVCGMAFCLPDRVVYKYDYVSQTRARDTWWDKFADTNHKIGHSIAMDILALEAN